MLWKAVAVVRAARARGYTALRRSPQCTVQQEELPAAGGAARGATGAGRTAASACAARRQQRRIGMRSKEKNQKANAA